jgi:hypothetical protein
MTPRLKMLLWCLMTAGFIFGYAGLVLPNQTAILETPRPDSYQFQRLHIFLFNLVSGGTVLLCFTQGQQKSSRRLRVYIVGSLIFSLVAFLNLYAISIALAVMLALVVESVRIEKLRFGRRTSSRSPNPFPRSFTTRHCSACPSGCSFRQGLCSKTITFTCFICHGCCWTASFWAFHFRFR